MNKSHTVTVLLYHFVCPSKYRKVVFDKAVDTTLVKICLEIEKVKMGSIYTLILFSAISFDSPTLIFQQSNNA